MKILHVINSLAPGGAEVLLTSYLLSSKNGYDLVNDVCLLFDKTSFLLDKLIDHKINVYNFKLKSKYSLMAIFQLIQLIKNNKYDIVHVHLFPSQYYCSIASLFVGKTKFIFTEHSIFNRRRTKKFFLFDYLSYSRYDKIICVSKLSEKNLTTWMPAVFGKTAVIYNGVKTNVLRKPDIKYDILLVGSFRDNGKGIDILLKAVKLIEDKVNKVAIAGDGILKDQMMELRNELCLKDKVDFLGFQSDIDSMLDQSRIFVLPSRWEGLPISILEAMTKMKPIIASSVGGIPELLENGISGLLVEPENIVMLADAIEKLLKDNELAKTLGEKAYEKVLESYSIDAYVNNIVEVYYKLLNSK